MYKRRWDQKKSQSQIGVVALGRDILQARIASSIAFVFILFAASSVAGITLVAQAEIGVGDYAPVEQHLSIARSQSAVLGVETSAIPNGNNPTLDSVTMSVEYTPLDFDPQTGMWDYIIEYNIPQMVNGSVSVGKKNIASQVLSSDLVETGYIIKPGSKNEISFGNKSGRFLTVTVTAPQKPVDENLDLSGDCPIGDHCGQEQSKPLPPVPLHKQSGGMNHPEEQ